MDWVERNFKLSNSGVRVDWLLLPQSCYKGSKKLSQLLIRQIEMDGQQQGDYTASAGGLLIGTPVRHTKATKVRRRGHKDVSSPEWRPVQWALIMHRLVLEKEWTLHLPWSIILMGELHTLHCTSSNGKYLWQKMVANHVKAFCCPLFTRHGNHGQRWACRGGCHGNMSDDS